MALPIVAADMLPPSEVDVPAMVIELFVNCELAKPVTCAEPLNAPIALPIVAADIVPPNEVDVPAIVMELFVKEPLPILDSVFDAPLIVLFVSVCDVVLKTTSSSAPKGPAIHLSFVVSHNKEPDVVVGDVASLTTIPALVAPEPFNEMMLSPIDTVVELTVVVVPDTVKFPLTVTSAPLKLIALLNEFVKEFNDDVAVFNALLIVFCEDVYEFKLLVAV